jgi:ATP-dependent Clp protease ATP-binding subunit ClpA
MTASSSATSASDNAKSKHTAAASGSSSFSATPTLQTSGLSINSSATFQQIKQTQASLARLYRVHQQQSQQQTGNGTGSQTNNNQSSQNQQQAKLSPDAGQQQRPTTFVDCLIRRFKNCFSEDFCTVPMFVVGNLSPGSDGK